jgi:hypothetical protein
MIAHIYPSVLQDVRCRAGPTRVLRPRGQMVMADMQDPASELPRIPIPRTPVNKGKKKGRGLEGPGPSQDRDYLLHAYTRTPSTSSKK